MRLPLWTLLIGLTGCNSNLQIATNKVDCSATPHASVCRSPNATVDNFMAEDAIIDLDSSSLVVSWNHASAIKNATISLSQDPNCNTKVSVFPSENGKPISLDQVADGIYYICLSTDVNGKEIVAANNGQRKVILDRTAPVIAPIDEIATNTTASIQTTVEDLSKVTIQWEVLTGPGTATITPNDTAAVSVSFSADGVYTLRITAKDEGGRKSTRDVKVTYDTVPPTVDAGPDALSNVALARTGVASADAKYITWSKVSGPGNLTWSQSSALSTTIAADTDGVYVVRLTAQDAAGNSAVDEFTLTWDTTGPAFVSWVLDGDAIDGYINDAEKSGGGDLFVLNALSYITASYSEPLSPSTSCDEQISYITTQSPRAMDLTSDGSWVFCVRLVDNANNKVFGKSATVIRDIASPSFTSLNGAHEAVDGFINANEQASTSALFTLVSSGASSYKYTPVLPDAGVTCDHLKTYSLSAIPNINDIPGANGAYVICVELKDAAGNTTYGKSQAITLDLTPPTVAAPSDFAARTLASLNATVSGATMQQWTKMSGPGAITFGDDSLEDTSVSADTDGSYVLRLTATDAAGNSAFDEVTLTWDQTPPAFTSLVRAGAALDSYVNDAELTDPAALWTLTASDQTSTKYSSALNDTTPVTCDDQQIYEQIAIATPADLPNADAPYVICVELKDAVGNTTYGKSEVITRDTSPPTVNVGPDVAVNTQHNLDATTTQGVSWQWTQQSGPGVITFGSATTEDTTVSASMDGVYILRLAVTDVAGNSAHAELNFTWQTSGPLISSFIGANEATDGYLNASDVASTQPLLALTASGYATAEFSAVLLNAGLVCDGNQTYGSGTIPLISAVPASDDTYAVCVKLTDVATNVTYGKSQPIVRDVVAPTVDAGADRVARATITLDATTSSATYAWSKTSGPGAISFGTPNAEDTTVSADTEGTYVLRLTATDPAGNSAFDEMNFTWDTTAPTFTSLAKTGDGSDDYINNAEKNNTTAIWVLTASDYSSVQYTEPLDNTLSVTCDGTQTYGENSIAGANALTAENPYVICVKLSDPAGNVTYGKSQVITRDTTPPTLNSLVGANGASDGYIKASEVGSAAVMFTASVSGAATTQFTAVLPNAGLTCDASQTYVASIPLISSTPASDDSYAICAKMTDAAGNVSYGKSQVIVRDTTPPTVNIGSTIYANAAKFIDATTTDAVSFSWTKTGGTGTVTFSPNNTEDTTVSNNTAGTSTIRLTVYDVAGNSASHTVSFVWDLTPPSFTSLLGINEASNQYINAAETGSTSPMLALTASGYALAEYTIPLDNTPAITCNSGKTYGTTTIPSPNDIPSADDDYVVCVKLSDEAGNVTYGKSQVIVRDTTPPIVNAGADVTKNALFSTLASISDGNTYAWTKQSGPGTVTFGTANGTNTTVTTNFDGTYVIRLTVWDAAGNSAYDEFTLIWDTTPPTVNAGTDITSPYQQTLNPTVGADAVSVAWSVISGVSQNVVFGDATSKTSTITGNRPGIYVIRLTATDAAGNSASDDLVLTVGGNDAHYMFATSTLQNGNLGGLAGADNICQTRANAAGLPGTFKAVLSSETVNANSRFTITGPIVNMRHEPLAHTQADLWDNKLIMSVGYTETGAVIPSSNVTIFTGTLSTGAKNPGNTCNSWTSSATGAGGGRANQPDDVMEGYAINCSDNAPIYCINTAPVAPSNRFRAYTGVINGRIILEYDLPADPSSYNRIDVRRSTGTTAPGRLLQQHITFFLDAQLLAKHNNHRAKYGWRRDSILSRLRLRFLQQPHCFLPVWKRHARQRRSLNFCVFGSL